MNSLGDMRKGQQGRITSIADNESVSQRLLALGLMPGVELKVSQVAPLGDPITVEFGFSRVSLRRAEASVVAVELIDSAAREAVA